MSKDIPLAISGPGEHLRGMNTWPASNPVLPYIDWRKEAEIMRRGREKRITKEQALQFLKLAGIDPKTGRVIAKSAK